MKEQKWLTNVKFVAVTEQFMGINILYAYICVYNFKSYWYKDGKRTMSAKQGLHKWS